MKKALTFLSIAVLAIALLALVGCAGSTPAANTPSTSATPAPGAGTAAASVAISNFAFSPADLTVKVGDSVTWTNNDSVAHTITSDAGDFDSGSIAQGATYTHKFDKAGTVSYHCAVHPSMTAKITVQ